MKSIITKLMKTASLDQIRQPHSGNIQNMFVNLCVRSPKNITITYEAGNSYYYSIQTPLSSRILFKN